MTPTGLGPGERHGMQATGQHPLQGSLAREPRQPSRRHCLAAEEIAERLEREGYDGFRAPSA